MKSKEFVRSKKDRLYEETIRNLEENNDTGFKTDDLKKILKTHHEHAWSKPMTYEELEAEMDSWDDELIPDETDAAASAGTVEEKHSFGNNHA